MEELQFKKATKSQAKVRIALVGPAGSGTTLTALYLARAFGGRTALVDTEHGSASKYADRFDFDTLHLTSFSPMMYIAAINAAERDGYDCLIIDTLSSAWASAGALLEMAEAPFRRSGENRFTAWREVTPHHNDLVNTLLGCDLHVIATLRSKIDYAVEPYCENGQQKSRIRRLGATSIQREGVDYEFDIVGEMDLKHNLVISKTRCPALEGRAFHKPCLDLANILKEWLDTGTASTTASKGIGNGNGAVVMSGVQLRKLIRLYCNLSGLSELDAIRWLDNLFDQNFHHQMKAATREEAEEFTAQLLSAQKEN